MSHDWKVGDVGVCIRSDLPWRMPEGIIPGPKYRETVRVTGIHIATAAITRDKIVGLELKGYSHLYDATSFRPMKKSTTDIFNMVKEPEPA